MKKNLFAPNIIFLSVKKLRLIPTHEKIIMMIFYCQIGVNKVFLQRPYQCYSNTDNYSDRRTVHTKIKIQGKKEWIMGKR